MKEKKEINFGLLVFALTTLVWVSIMGFMLGEISKEHKEEIRILKEKCNNNDNK